MAVKKKSAAKKKVASKKAVAKKAVTKKAAVKKTAAAPKAAEKKVVTTAIATKQTKTQIIAAIAEDTGMSKKEVNAVFASLGNLVERHMKKRGSGEFSVPEIGVKLRRIKKPAVKARKGINPFTGEETMFKAKPARNVVKAAALKKLKDMAS